jgi:pimeloyl-ACP methyl ester carboxylesterase
MQNEPTLILCHGSWHGAWAFDELVKRLPGVPIQALELPSAGADPAALGDMYGDAALVSRAVEAVDGPVVVLGHSTGSIPMTQALGSAGNVRRLIYLCAFVLDEGESVLSSIGGELPALWDVHEDETLTAGGHVVVNNPEEAFYNDLPPDVAARTAARLRLQGWATKVQPVTEAAWKTIPSTYVVCDRDNAIPPAGQEFFASRVQRVHHLDAGHSPFLSRPDDLAALIRAELAA